MPGPFPDQLGAEEVGKGPVELTGLVVDGLKRAVLEEAAHHGGALYHALGMAGEAVDPRGEHSTERGGDRPSLWIAREDPALAIASQHALLDQRADQLFKEERIALGSLEHAATDGVGKVGHPEEVVGEPLAVRGAERRQADSLNRCL